MKRPHSKLFVARTKKKQEKSVMTSKVAHVTLLVALNLMLVTGFCAAHKVYEQRKPSSFTTESGTKGKNKQIKPTKPKATNSPNPQKNANGSKSTAQGVNPKKVKQNRSPFRVLARITVYWAKGGGTDSWSAKNLSSTGARLQCGAHAAVDPKVIPYGSKVQLKRDQKEVLVKAVDTGSAVKARKAAIAMGKTPLEKQAPVVDLFFQNRSAALNYAKNNPAFQWVKVFPPQTTM